ncbi:hypothetical protein FHX42_002488 [Saccharopolyspora lacisalsi]|uniref:Cell wall anchor protein n=1 Tax=Halosaccharopolyspora lacisalsi TaxID=1000566 RepID=A0A839E069_9PSEU|nr:DUF6319 family protein [Halosaccharopolyspora lacisalsi]MBA8825137.1 hypothetical protein [Halosaccharopolyspora lacisalsi]
MSQARALSSEEINGLREELAAGTTPTVWFTAAAVGVEQGRSGKVTALGEPAEGDFIQVRPAGSKDVLSFSAGEVTVVKPERKVKNSGERSASDVKASSAKRTSEKSEAKSSEKSEAKTSGKAGAKASEKSETKPSGSAADGGTADSGKSETKSSATRSGGTAKRKAAQHAGATVTLTADAEGQWSVEVNNGKKRVLRPTSVPASVVGQAARTLHVDVADAVEPMLEAAREQQRSRIEQLQRELSDAQQKLDELDH